MPINSATNYLKYANLQMASEALLDQFAYNTQAGLQAALEFGNNRSSKFPPALAQEFSNDWRVVAYQANTPLQGSARVPLKTRTFLFF